MWLALSGENTVGLKPWKPWEYASSDTQIDTARDRQTVICTESMLYSCRQGQADSYMYVQRVCCIVADRDRQTVIYVYRGYAVQSQTGPDTQIDTDSNRQTIICTEGMLYMQLQTWKDTQIDTARDRQPDVLKVCYIVADVDR